MVVGQAQLAPITRAINAKQTKKINKKKNYEKDEKQVDGVWIFSGGLEHLLAFLALWLTKGWNMEIYPPHLQRHRIGLG